MADNILDILKRFDVQQNVTIRVIDEPTGQVVQEYIGHNAATNSMLTGIAHYLVGDGVLNQGGDILTMWVPQYISLGTMGLTSQNSETLDGGEIVPSGLGYTPEAPTDATAHEKELNAQLRFSEYITQTPGYGADGYDADSNNDREWFGLGRPYTLKPDPLKQNFYTWNGSATTFTLSETPISIISATVYPGGEVNQDTKDTGVVRIVLPSTSYRITTGKNVQFDAYSGSIPSNSRLAIIYTYESADAANCELIKAEIIDDRVVSRTLRSAITYRDMIPEIQSEVPNTLDVVYSAFISTGALKDYRGDNDYVYITEAGLWSRPDYNESGDNGLLAGYRITPPEVIDTSKSQQFTGDGEKITFTFVGDIVTSIVSVAITDQPVTEEDYYLDTNTNSIVFTGLVPADDATITVSYKTADTQDSWKDMTIPANRERIQKSILRVGINQVVQVIWKIQLGGLEQLSGLSYLYPPQTEEEVWTIV